MSSRRAHDQPAVLIAALLGGIIVLASLPFTVDAFRRESDKGSDIAISWSEGPAHASTATVDTNTATATTKVLFTGIPAMVHVASKTCSDSATSSPVPQPAASITVKVSKTVGTKEEQLGSVTYSCANVPDPVFMKMTDHPDIGKVTAKSDQEALDSLKSREETATYTITVTTSRPASTLPPAIPVGAPTLTADVELAVHGWVASAGATPGAGK
jgi:hypothetical protein